MKLKSKVELKGSKTKGYIVTISDNYGYKEDFAVTRDELIELKRLIILKVK